MFTVFGKVGECVLYPVRLDMRQPSVAGKAQESASAFIAGFLGWATVMVMVYSKILFLNFRLSAYSTPAVLFDKFSGIPILIGTELVEFENSTALGLGCFVLLVVGSMFRTLLLLVPVIPRISIRIPTSFALPVSSSPSGRFIREIVYRFDLEARRAGAFESDIHFWEWACHSRVSSRLGFAGTAIPTRSFYHPEASYGL
jgi:hypothetical protein